MCPLCSKRKARRECPALGQLICPVCCATKRQIEIRCPPDCVYLTSAREHPAAAVVRRQQQDVALVISFVRDLNTQQSELFLLTSDFLARYPAPSLQPIIDDDVMEAAGALAATFETAVRGVIYEHRPASVPAERLLAGLKAMYTEAGKHRGTAFEREAAVVLRRLEQAVKGARVAEPENRRAFLDLVGRVVKPRERPGETADPVRVSSDQEPRLIVP
jgi:hypothetical protein